MNRVVLSLFSMLFCFTAVFAEEASLQERLQKHIKYAPEGTNKVGHILINDRTSGITQGTWVYVKKALEYYKEQKPIFIILELNTPGGEVFAAQNISDALKEMDIQQDIPVIAYVNNWAISAGAMLAYSTRFIAITKDASMGAAEPVLADAAGEMKQASEKVNSAIRSDMINRARFFDRNPLIAEAMVDKDLILVLRGGEFVKLDNESQISASDTVVSPKGKLLTLDSELLMKYHVADILVPPVKTEGKPALFHTPFFDSIPNVVIDEFKPDWKTNFFMFLANPIVASALFLGMMLGFYMEMNMPGATLPGVIAAICLFLIILSSFNQEIGNYLEVILLSLGLLIIAVELFVLPTFGLLGILGIILFLIGLFGLMLPGIHNFHFDFDTQTVNAAGQIFFERLAILSATMLFGLGIMLILRRFFPSRFSPFNRFILQGNEQTDYLAVDDPKTLPEKGTVGTVFASLRPSGKVVIDGKIYDALTRGNFIEKDEAVKIIGFAGGVMVVDKHEEKN